MEWTKLSELQKMAYNRRIVVCAWRPANLQITENCPIDFFIHDKEAKPVEFKSALDLPSAASAIRVIIEKNGKATIFYPNSTIGLIDYTPETPLEASQDTPKVYHLIESGDRHVNPKTSKYRSMTLDEVKALTYNDHPFVKLNNGRVGTVKINGKVRRWKREPDAVEVPTKYGLYEYYTFTNADIDRLLVKLN